MALGTEFTKIAVTDRMLAVLKSAANIDDEGAERLAAHFLAAGEMGLVRARGGYHAAEQLTALVRGEPSAEDMRAIRMQCLSMVHDIGAAAEMVEFVLAGKKPEDV